MSKASASSAGFQPAVSLGFQPAGAGLWLERSKNRAFADWKSAIQQLGNLRYFSGNWRLVLGFFLVLVASMLLLFSGCSVGPNYKRPTIDSPAAFRGDSSPTNKSIGDLDWWNVYQDATLQALVREAFTNNYDLRIALTRMEQASALAMQARSQFVPSVDYNGTVSRGRNVEFGSAFPNNARTVNSASATLNAFC